MYIAYLLITPVPARLILPSPPEEGVMYHGPPFWLKFTKLSFFSSLFFSPVVSTQSVIRKAAAHRGTPRAAERGAVTRNVVCDSRFPSIEPRHGRGPSVRSDTVIPVRQCGAQTPVLLAAAATSPVLPFPLSRSRHHSRTSASVH